jgi:YD repeat-containing protein
MSLLAAAQVPSLDPTQTVNLATGQMQFCLPLGTVQGVGGNDFPVALGYQAGIRTSQQASPVGLGFSCDFGSVTRSIISCPDDYLGANCDWAQNTYVSKPFWIAEISILLYVISALVTLISLGGATPLSLALSMISAGLSITFAVASTVFYNSLDFSAGGTHLPAYWTQENAPHFGGFFTGEQGDLPDIYLVNTPYVSGEIVWSGSPATGHFVFRNSSGSGKKDNSTIDVVYKYPVDGTEVFVITLPDGTKLTFDVVDAYPIHMVNYAFRNENGMKADVDTKIRLHKSVPMIWHLSKAEFPSSAPITFTYRGIGVNTGIYKASADYMQTGRGVVSKAYIGDVGYVGPCPYSKFDLISDDPINVYFPAGVQTQNQSATFDYAKTREDDCWYYGSAAFGMPQLTGIRFFSKGGSVYRYGSVYRNVTFETKYTLRPGGSKPSGAGNPSAASLTLDAVRISDGAGVSLPPIMFTYAKNPSLASVPTKTMSFYTRSNGSDVNYTITLPYEYRDVWGYYSAGTDWNKAGTRTRVLDCDAWSLSKVAMPNGMTITWTYEPNAYDACNNVSVTSDVATKAPKYGGGIRVRSMTVEDGVNPSTTRTFIYTDTPGRFVEEFYPGRNSWNSSGHATVEPFNYIEEGDYRTFLVTRGGHYTPAKVLYEMVQVVDKYYTGSYTLNGYTVNKFTTSKEYPNTGLYGESDYSWKRGLSTYSGAFNSMENPVSETTNEYAFVENSPTLFLDFNSIGTSGWVKQTKTSTTNSGVKTSRTIKYGDELGSPDRVTDLAVTSRGWVPASCGRLDEPFLWRAAGCWGYLDENSIRDLVYMTAITNTTSGTIDYYRINVLKDADLLGTPTYGIVANPRAVWSDVLGELDGLSPPAGIGVANLGGRPYSDVLVAFRSPRTSKNFYKIWYDAYISSTTVQFESSSNWIELPALPVGVPAWFSLGNIDSDSKLDIVYFCDRLAGYCNIKADGTFTTPVVGPTLQLPRIAERTECRTKMTDWDGDGMANDMILYYAYPIADDRLQWIGFVLRNLSVSGPSLSFASAEALPVSPTSGLFVNDDQDYERVGRLYGIDVVERTKSLAFLDPRGRTQLFDWANVPFDLDGQPNEVSATNSDGKTIVSTSRPAYWEYPGMGAGTGNSHMLAQTCQSTTFGDLADPTKAVSSSATTWALDNGRWLPKGSYVWRAPMLSTGYSSQSLSTFVFGTTEPTTLPSGWLCSSRNSLFGSLSQVLETVNNPLVPALTNYSSVLYDKTGIYPVATVSNARYGEGLFTSWEEFRLNYQSEADDPTAVWTDPALNRGANTRAWILARESHSGTRCLKLGVSSTSDPYVCTDDSPVPGMSAAKKVRWEFWAKADAASTTSFTHLQSPVDNTWYGDFPFTAGTSWQKYSFEATVPAGKRYHVVLRPPATAAHAWLPGALYYDDVRAYPTDALMASTVYDETLGLPTSASDANNSISKIVYDSYGRPTAKYDSKGQLVKNYSYHYMSELYTNQFNDDSQNFIVSGGSPVRSIVTGGMGPAGSCSMIDFKGYGVGNMVRLNLPSANFAGKKGTVRGYYKSTSGNKVQVGFWLGSNSIIKEFPADGSWQTFSIDFDCTGLTPSNVTLYADMYSGSNCVAYFDEINAFGW